MPRVVTYCPITGEKLSVVVTWTREEMLKRLEMVNTFAHKRVVARDYQRRLRAGKITPS